MGSISCEDYRSHADLSIKFVIVACMMHTYPMQTNPNPCVNIVFR